MKYQELKKQYRDLETRVFSSLREEIRASKHKAKYLDEKAIKIDIENFVEIAIVNDALTLMDATGYQYSIFELSIEELINILNSI